MTVSGKIRKVDMRQEAAARLGATASSSGRASAACAARTGARSPSEYLQRSPTGSTSGRARVGHQEHLGGPPADALTWTSASITSSSDIASSEPSASEPSSTRAVNHGCSAPSRPRGPPRAA